jgi:cytochrome c-type biogenesis protein CcmH
MTAALLFAALLGAATQDALPAPGQPEPAERVLPAVGRYVEETEIDRLTREVSAQLRCVVCQGLSLQDSPSQLAQEMRAIVREKLAEGMTPAEVKTFFVERYGEWVLLEPEPRGFNLLVYILPVAMLFGGAGFVFFRARSWTRAGQTAAEQAQQESVGADSQAR